MGGGNPVQSAKKFVKDPVRSVTAMATLGGSEAVRAADKDFYNKQMGSIEKFAEDPGRMALAAGTMGMSEQLRFAKNETVRTLTPDMPDLPNFNTPDAPPTNTPTPEDAAGEVEKAPDLQDQLAPSKKRGRASTILSGPQGLSGSNQYSARKTLLGA